MSRETGEIERRDVAVWDRRLFSALRAALRVGYFSLEVIGAEHVPRSGPVVYVGNHGGWFALDALVFALAVHDHVGPDRIPYAVVEDVLVRAPGLREFFRPLGVIPASRMRHPGTLPKEIETFGFFPEGSAGICKPFWQAYRMKPWRSGFVRLALLRGARVVPVSLVGSEECLPTLGGLPLFERWIKAPIPLPLSLVPLPARWRIAFGPPVDLGRSDPEGARDTAFCRSAAARVQAVVQAQLDAHTKDRLLRRWRAR